MCETENAKQSHRISYYFSLFGTSIGILYKKKAAKRDSPERKILDNVWGEVPPHCTTAVMGPSGAGYVLLILE